jgi:hypothetical protein
MSKLKYTMFVANASQVVVDAHLIPHSYNVLYHYNYVIQNNDFFRQVVHEALKMKKN